MADPVLQKYLSGMKGYSTGGISHMFPVWDRGDA